MPSESAAAGTYRCRRHVRPHVRDTWHFCPTCPEWPTTKYIDVRVKPVAGDLCAECIAREAQGVCGASAPP